MVRVRDATLDDAGQLTRVHVRAWREGYRGLIPNELISKRAARRADEWHTHLVSIGEREHVLLAESDGVVLGFASGGPSRDEDLDAAITAEVTGLYVDPDHWRRGIGRALLVESLERLRGDRFATAALWVLAENERAVRFYEAAGWERDGAERRHPERRALELRYRLSNLCCIPLDHESSFRPSGA